MTTYDDWNAAIAEHSFPDGHPGRPVYLAVDDELLESLGTELGVEDERGVDSYLAALRAKRQWTNTYGPYTPVFDAWQRWRKAPSGVPPYIALLGLASLAAARMASDSARGISANNYYRHFNDLIGRDKDGQPPAFDQFRRLWEDLSLWLDEDLKQARGASTVRAHPHWTHIGYPISQCLLREADRRRLTQFFRAVGLEPDDDVSADRLMTLLRGWAARGGTLSDQGRRVVAASTGDLAAELGEIVKREFDGWDGQLVDGQGRRRADVALQLILRRGGRVVEARLVPRRPEGFPEGPALLRSGHTVMLEAGLDDEWYQPLGLKVTRGVLDDGLAATLGEHAFAYEASTVVPMRASLELGGWISVPQALPLEEHAVIAHPAAADDVRRFLRAHAAAGWAEPVAREGLPPGWQLFTGVRIGSDVDPPSGDLRRLVPRLGVSMKLEGGLKIARDQYLVGGEPDLWVTVEAGQSLSVLIDGEDLTLSGGVHRIRLSERELPPGPQELSLPGQTRRFSTLEGFPQVAADGTGSLAHVLECHGTYRPRGLIAGAVDGESPSRGSVWIRGAEAKGAKQDLPAAAGRPILLRRGFRGWTLLGATPGEVLTCFAPPARDWLKPLRLEPGIVFDQACPFEPAWVLYESSGGTLVRTLARGLVTAKPPPPARKAEVGRAVEDAWSEAITAAAEADVPAEHADAWQLYQEAAR